MSNGSNTWGVEYHRIMWFENLLTQHKNVLNVSRSHDILFTVQRKRQGDTLQALCCYEYTMGITTVLKALEEFGHLDIIHIGGGWCGYTKEAKEHCLNQSIGLYVSNEMSGALWKNEFWDYHQKDQDGNPVSFCRGDA